MKMIRSARPVARMGEIRNAYRILVRKSEGKRRRWRHKHRREDNIKVDLNRHFMTV